MGGILKMHSYMDVTGRAKQDARAEEQFEGYAHGWAVPFLVRLSIITKGVIHCGTRATQVITLNKADTAGP